LKIYEKIPLYKNSLYNDEKIKISILFPCFDKFNIHSNYLDLSNIKSFLNQSLREIEILISLDKKNINNQTIEIFKSFHNIKIFNCGKDIFNDTMNLISNSNGKYITILNENIELLAYNFFEKLYTKTYGETKNIIKYELRKKENYLIKYKILKDIIDNGISFKNFSDLKQYIQLNNIPNLNYIYISYSLDNKYIFYTYVSIISVLETKNFNTYISFYLLVPKDFSNKNKNIIFRFRFYNL
jgi:hypothetical protein